MLSYKYKRFVYLSPFANNRLVHYFRYLIRKKWIDVVLKKFGREQEKDAILPQMRRAFVKYHWNAEEFFLFGYERLSEEQKLSFCPEYDHNVFCLRVNDYSVAKIFRDKYATYQLFKDYFKRDCVYVQHLEDLNKEEVKTFLIANKLFLAKPVNESCGHGILMIDQGSEQLEHLIALAGSAGGYLLEPCIQHR